MPYMLILRLFKKINVREKKEQCALKNASFAYVTLAVES